MNNGSRSLIILSFPPLTGHQNSDSPREFKITPFCTYLFGSNSVVSVCVCVCVCREYIYWIAPPKHRDFNAYPGPGTPYFLLHCSRWKCALLYPDCNMLTHLLCTWCLSSAYCMQDPVFSLSEARLHRGCAMDRATPMGGGAGLSGWVCWQYLCWPVAGVWGGSSMWVKLRNPAALQWQEFLKGLDDMSVSLTNTEPVQF